MFDTIAGLAALAIVGLTAGAALYLVYWLVLWVIEFIATIINALINREEPR